MKSFLDTLSGKGDHYLHLAGWKTCSEADGRLGWLCAYPEGWARKADLNLAVSGKFSSGRMIAEHVRSILANGNIEVQNPGTASQ